MAASPNLRLVGANGSLLELVIDNERPRIDATATLEFPDGEIAQFSSFQTSFRFNGTAIARFEGTAHDVGGVSSFEGAVGGFDLACTPVLDAGEPMVTCLYDPANSNPGYLPTGPAPLTLTAVDAAGNLRIVTVGTLIPDYAPPALGTEPFYTVKDAGGIRVARGPDDPSMGATGSLEIVLAFDESLAVQPRLQVEGIDTIFLDRAWQAGESVAVFELAFASVALGLKALIVTVTDEAGNTAELHIGNLIIIP
jgi:hypothetical protein